MRSESELKLKLEELRTIRKDALEHRRIWSYGHIQQEIETLLWVLGEKEQL